MADKIQISTIFEHMGKIQYGSLTEKQDPYRLIPEPILKSNEPGVSHKWIFSDLLNGTLIVIRLFKDGMVQCYCTNHKEHSFHECSSLAGRRTMLITTDDFYNWFIRSFE